MISLSRHHSDEMRGKSVQILAPMWEKLLNFKFFFLHPTGPSPFSQLTLKEKNQQLGTENQLLENEIFNLQKLLDEQFSLSSQISRLSLNEINQTPDFAVSENYRKSLQTTFQTTSKRIKAMPARVIFRSFDTWNSFIWIDVGEEKNQDFPSPVIAYNSPVVIGKAVIGIIDYVGKTQSRVRLISDNQVTPSVRALRGTEQDFFIQDQIEMLLRYLEQKNDLSISLELQKNLLNLLDQLKSQSHLFKKTQYLAKGELSGSIHPTRNGQQVILKGTGFNYDFSDEEGTSRDLRNGKMKETSQEQTPTPLLKVNDILITTGMDGIFPPGFQAGIITHIKPLKEGDYFYTIEAKPIVGQLDELSLVFVLPPEKSFVPIEGSLVP